MIQSLGNSIRSPALWLAFSVALLCIGLQFAGLSETWRFDRQQIDSGSWYQLLSGNFVHLGRSHLWMNMAGFALVVVLVWHRFNSWQWLIITLVSSLFVGILLYFRDPHILWYVGFSGTLHGLIVAGCLADLKFYPRSAAALLLLVIGKLVWEQLAGPLPGSESVAGGSVAVNSHLYGAIGGALSAALFLLPPRFRKRADAQTPP